MPSKATSVLVLVLCCICAGITLIREYYNTNQINALQKQVETLQKQIRAGTTTSTSIITTTTDHDHDHDEQEKQQKQELPITTTTTTTTTTNNKQPSSSQRQQQPLDKEKKNEAAPMLSSVAEEAAAAVTTTPTKKAAAGKKFHDRSQLISATVPIQQQRSSTTTTTSSSRTSDEAVSTLSEKKKNDKKTVRGEGKPGPVIRRPAITTRTKKATTTAPTPTPTPPPTPTPTPPPTPPISKLNLKDFRICRIDNPKPKFHKEPVKVPGTVMPVEYQCDGEPYHQFATLLEDLIPKQARLKDAEFIPPWGKGWGRRRLLIPYHPAGRTILILGNSHTRQLVSTLLCQYKDQIVGQPQLLFSMPNLESYGVWKYQMLKNITIYSATNCPFIYNPQWYDVLEKQILKRPLSSLDAIVVGKFNQYSESTGTNFLLNMLEYQKGFPELNIDFQNAKVPSLKDIAKIYAGPIVYVGMFAKYGNAPYQQALTTIRRQQRQDPPRNNLMAIDGRKYITLLEKAIQAETSPLKNLLQPVQECSTDDRYKVTTCVTNTSSYRFSNGHRCMGARGGHPDLIAWDVVDFLHQILGSSGSQSTRQ